MNTFSDPHAEYNTGITAVVVDDDKDTVSVLSDFLQIKGVEVVGKGYDGQEAIELYKRIKPDVLFLDVMMERFDGFYALERIRQTHHDAFVIVVTADLTCETHDRLENLKASAIIHKPYDINEIMRILGRISPGVVASK